MGSNYKLITCYGPKCKFRYLRNRSRVFPSFSRIGFSPLLDTKNPSRRLFYSVVLVSEPQIFSKADEADLVNMESNGSVSSTVNLEKILCERLVDQSQPISERFRALFSLRNLKGPGPRNALILGLFYHCCSKSYLSYMNSTCTRNKNCYFGKDVGA